jgi:hypothetical protein
MAGRASLTFLGQDDIALSGEPEVTYFIERYPGSTLFASRVDKVIFDEAGVSFGSENHITIPHHGDLITDMYLHVDFPSQISSVLDSVGTLMFQYVELYIGSELIERLYGEFIEMKFDLEIPKGKQPALSALDGKNLQFLVAPNSTYKIPLRFSCFHKGLPTCAFKEDVTFRIIWNPSTIFTSPPINFTSHFNAYLNIEYTYLSKNEISYIKSLNPRRLLIEQVQLNQFTIPHGYTSARCVLQFYNPVKELFFVFQNDSALGYDYSVQATSTSTSIGTGDILSNLELNFNTTDRISYNVGSPQFLGTIQPLEFHTRTPDRIFYMYSFSLDPENDSPSGSVNLSRINNQILDVNINSTPTNVNLRVYAVSYNFLETSNNSARVVFSNFF